MIKLLLPYALHVDRLRSIFALVSAIYGSTIDRGDVESEDGIFASFAENDDDSHFDFAVFPP
jgi:hypothetical protein